MAASGNGVVANNIKRLSRIDLAGSGQIIVKGDYAYIGHMDPPNGTTIMDISDPRKPKIVSQINLDNNFSHTHKVRVNGDIMITNVEQYDRHFFHLGHRIPEIRAKLETELGHPATDAEIAKVLKVEASDVPVLDQARERGYGDGGFKVYDIADRANPKLLTHHKTAGFGTHRFDADDRYAYISTEMEGYIGNILVIYDMNNPASPEEVSRWAMPGQHIAGGETPTWRGYRNRLHHALRQGDTLWAAVWQAGLRVLDISDITKPTCVGEYNYHPPYLEPSHTFLKVPFPVDGRDVALVIDEEHDYIPGQPHACMWVFDVTDMANIHPLSSFHVSEMDSPYSRMVTKEDRFGAHQYQEHFEDTKVYATWFAGGLRVVDIKNPSLPVEVASFIPEPGKGGTTPQSNDVEVDERGLIYMVDRVNGLDILELTV